MGRTDIEGKCGGIKVTSVTPLIVSVNFQGYWCKVPLTTATGAVGFCGNSISVRFLSWTCWILDYAVMIDGSGFDAKADSQ